MSVLGRLKVLSPCCRDAARLLSESMDHRLPLAERVGLRVHLLLCGLCRRYGRQLIFLRRLVEVFAKIAETPATPVASEMSQEARARIRERLERS
jgi:hypothetical protein